jgi:hypothetical protein
VLRRLRVAAAFFPAATRFGDFRPVDLAAVFRRVVFLAVDFFAVLFLRVVVFLAVDRFAVLFLRAGFRAVDFLAVDVFRLAGFLAVVFLAVDRFLAAVFFAAIAVPLSSVPGAPLASFALATEPPNLRVYEGSWVTTPSV